MVSCEHLEVIVESELEKGNSIDKIEFDKWTNVKKVIIFGSELLDNEYEVDNKIEYWENRDTHYPTQNGYICKKCNCAIAFPMKL